MTLLILLQLVFVNHAMFIPLYQRTLITIMATLSGIQDLFQLTPDQLALMDIGSAMIAYQKDVLFVTTRQFHLPSHSLLKSNPKKSPLKT